MTEVGQDWRASMFYEGEACCCTCASHVTSKPPIEVGRLKDEQIREALLSGARSVAISMGLREEDLVDHDEESLQNAVTWVRWCEPLIAAAWGYTLKGEQ